MDRLYRIIESAAVAAVILVGSFAIGYAVTGIVHAAASRYATLAGALK